MKYIVIIGDGMADYRVESLDNKTPLMYADTPNMDFLASHGRLGLFKTIPDDMPTGSAVANLTVLGYDTHICYQGRGILEAASMNIDIKDNQAAFRCNLVSVSDSKLKNHSAGHISNDEAKQLINYLNENIGYDNIKFYPGLSYRNLLIADSIETDLICYPPHDHVEENIDDLLIKPKNDISQKSADFLNDITKKSMELLKDHPVNLERKSNGLKTADSIWLWSPGHKPEMKTYQEKYGLSGAVISAVDLIKGIGKYAGFEIIDVAGATGLYTTNYEGKATAAVEALKKYDFVYVHVEASDEAGHERDLDLKIKTIEYLDKRLLKNILTGIKDIKDEITIAVLPDHPTPISSGKHTRESVPVLISNPIKESYGLKEYNEDSARDGSLGLMYGEDFIRKLIE